MKSVFGIVMATAITATSSLAFARSSDDEMYPWKYRAEMHAIEKALENSVAKNPDLEFSAMTMFVLDKTNSKKSGMLNRIDLDRATSTVKFHVRNKKTKKFEDKIIFCEVETLVQRDRQNESIIKGINAKISSCQADGLKLTADTQSWHSAMPITVPEFIAKNLKQFEEIKTCDAASRFSSSLAISYGHANGEGARKGIEKLLREITRTGVCFGDVLGGLKLSVAITGNGKELVKVMQQEWESSKLENRFGELSTKSKVGEAMLKANIEARDYAAKQDQMRMRTSQGTQKRTAGAN